MSVVRIENRVAEVAERVLIEVSAPDDQVGFGVWLSDHIECDHDTECDSAHEITELVNILVVLKIEACHGCGAEHHVKANWAMTLNISSNDYIEDRVRSAWESILFARSAHAMGDLDEMMDALADGHEG